MKFSKKELQLIYTALELWDEANDNELEKMGKEPAIKKLLEKIRENAHEKR